MFNTRIIRNFVLITGVVVACLLTPMTISSAIAADKNMLRYEVYQSPERDFMTNAVIVYGEKYAVLIDTSFTKSSGDKLAQRVKKLGRQLVAIYLTHGHPDHTFATSQVLSHFPSAKVYASPGVIGELTRDFYSKLVRWHIDYPNDLATELPQILPLQGDIMLEGHKIQWLDTVGGESWDATVFFIPSTKTLITGDLIFNKMHLYNADVYQPQRWIDILDSLQATFGEIKTVVPGHGKVGDASLIDLNREYLEELISVATLPFPDLDKVHNHMVKKYPGWKWPMILHMTRGPAVTYPELIKHYVPK